MGDLASAFFCLCSGVVSFFLWCPWPGAGAGACPFFFLLASFFRKLRRSRSPSSAGPAYQKHAVGPLRLMGGALLLLQLQVG